MTIFFGLAKSRNPPAVDQRLEHRGRHGQRIRAPAFATSPMMKYFLLLTCSTATLTSGWVMYFASPCVMAAGKLLGSEPGGLDFIHQRERDPAVRPHRELSGQLRLAPDPDQQHILRPDDVILRIDGRPAHDGGCRGLGRSLRGTGFPGRGFLARLAGPVQDFQTRKED